MMTPKVRTVLLAYSTFTAMLVGALLLQTFRDIGRAEAQPLALGSSEVIVPMTIDAGVADAPPDMGGSAVMAPAPPMPPTETAKQSVESGWSLVEDYGPIWAGMLVLFGAGVAFVKRYPDHWLAKGHALTGGVSAIAILGALLEANFTKASGAGIAVTLLLALKLILQKPVVPSK